MQHHSMPIMPVWSKVPALSAGLPLLVDRRRHQEKQLVAVAIQHYLFG
jgi:hypothetical protein